MDGLGPIILMMILAGLVAALAVYALVRGIVELARWTGGSGGGIGIALAVLSASFDVTSPVEIACRKNRSPEQLMHIKTGPIERHTLSVTVDNESGVLARIAGMFSARGYNIESLTVADISNDDAVSPHHHRDERPGGGDRTGGRTTRPAGSGPQGHRPDRRSASMSSASWRWSKSRAPASTGSRRCGWPKCFAPMSSIRRSRASSSRSPARAIKIDRFIELMGEIGLVEVARTGIVAMARGKTAV